MSDLPNSTSAESNASSRKSRSLPKGCSFLLAVASILILLGLGAFYSFSQQIEAVRKKEQQITVVTIGNAVMQFQADYNRLPLPSGPLPEGGDRDTDTSPAHGFTAVLLGQEAATGERQNTRNTFYIEGTKSAKPKLGGDYRWKNGLIQEASTATYGIVDAQGRPYRIRLDTNNDKELANPNSDEVAEGRASLAKMVIVWGAGKDGDWETWKDNPKSWD